MPHLNAVRIGDRGDDGYNLVWNHEKRSDWSAGSGQDFYTDVWQSRSESGWQLSWELNWAATQIIDRAVVTNDTNDALMMSTFTW